MAKPISTIYTICKITHVYGIIIKVWQAEDQEIDLVYYAWETEFKEAWKGFPRLTVRVQWMKITTLLSFSEEQCFIICIDLLS